MRLLPAVAFSKKLLGLANFENANSCSKPTFKTRVETRHKMSLSKIESLDVYAFVWITLQNLGKYSWRLDLRKFENIVVLVFAVSTFCSLKNR